MKPLPTVVGLGEILWDLLPSGRQLGGAPANFAYCAHLLGDRAVVASRIAESVKRANVLKLNHDEVSRIGELLAVDASEGFTFCEEVLRKFDLQLICITRGANGSLLCDPKNAHEHPGFQIQVKDTVGAGDAFTAALVHGHLRGHSRSEERRVGKECKCRWSW